MKGNYLPVNFSNKNEKILSFGEMAEYGTCPGSEIPNPKSFLGGKNKYKWLDIEMRCAVCAAAKVENYS
jgi:hypothetical protein